MPPVLTSARPPRKRRRYAFVILGLLAVVLVLAGLKYAQIASLISMGKQMEKAGPPPEAVGSDIAQAGQWETTLAAVGTVAGVESVAVSNESPGIVTRINFESGQMVKRGQTLVELDAGTERAQLASAKARRANALITAQRSRMLVARDALPRATLDADETQLKAATSEVGALQAQIDLKTVRAPFRGRLGIRAVNIGQYLAPGTTITTLDSAGEVYVDFSLPQEQLTTVAVGMPVRISIRGAEARGGPTANPAGQSAKQDPGAAQSGRPDPGAQGAKPNPGAARGAKPRPGAARAKPTPGATQRAQPNRSSPTQLNSNPEDPTAMAITGTITAVDPTLDSATRNLKVRASVAKGSEAARQLRPGMFVSVVVVTPQLLSVVMVPATAIVHASFGDSVFVIEDKPPDSPGMAKTPDGKPVKLARQQFVRLGVARGDFVAITEGITAGQVVVSAGAFKLRNGSPVVIDNAVKPKPELDPHPENR